MHESETWRDLLRTITKDSREKQRVLETVGIKAITLNRWINKESDPRPQNLRTLLNALPQYREQLLDLIREENGFEDFLNGDLDDTSKEIPSAFYVRVFATRSGTTESMRFWSLSNMILQQAIGQLDPDRMGMSVVVVRCMPPSSADNKVHSLRESVGVGTPPWESNLEQRGMFLGAESLCGYGVTISRPSAIQNVEDEQSLIPAHRVAFEKSASVYPILYAGRIAGCLLVSSTQYNYFLSRTRNGLIEQYANLLALAFAPDEFYEAHQIGLQVMPHQEKQKEYFANFRQRVAHTMLEGARKRQPVSSIVAEEMVWRDLEEELLHLSAKL